MTDKQCWVCQQPAAKVFPRRAAFYLFLLSPISYIEKAEEISQFYQLYLILSTV